MPRALKTGGRDGSENMDITASIKPPEGGRRRRGFLLRFLGFAFAAGMVVFVAIAGAAGFVLWKVSKDLPDYEALAKYEPPVMTRIHANDGNLIAEFARERRIYCALAVRSSRNDGVVPDYDTFSEHPLNHLDATFANIDTTNRSVQRQSLPCGASSRGF